MCSGTISHVNGARYLIVSVTCVVVFMLPTAISLNFLRLYFASLKLKISPIIFGDKLFFHLNISVANTCRFR